jgi:hypothetical protein
MTASRDATDPLITRTVHNNRTIQTLVWPDRRVVTTQLHHLHYTHEQGDVVRTGSIHGRPNFDAMDQCRLASGVYKTSVCTKVGTFSDMHALEGFGVAIRSTSETAAYYNQGIPTSHIAHAWVGKENGQRVPLCTVYARQIDAPLVYYTHATNTYYTVRPAAYTAVCTPGTLRLVKSHHPPVLRGTPETWTQPDHATDEDMHTYTLNPGVSAYRTSNTVASMDPGIPTYVEFLYLDGAHWAIQSITCAFPGQREHTPIDSLTQVNGRVCIQLYDGRAYYGCVKNGRAHGRATIVDARGAQKHARFEDGYCVDVFMHTTDRNEVEWIYDDTHRDLRVRMRCQPFGSITVEHIDRVTMRIVRYARWHTRYGFTSNETGQTVEHRYDDPLIFESARVTDGVCARLIAHDDLVRPPVAFESVDGLLRVSVRMKNRARIFAQPSVQIDEHDSGAYVARMASGRVRIDEWDTDETTHTLRATTSAEKDVLQIADTGAWMMRDIDDSGIYSSARGLEPFAH